MATVNSDNIISLDEAIRIIFGDEFYNRVMCPKDGQTSGSGSSANTGPQQTAGKRFELPAYNSEDPEIWFLTCEIIFDDYEVNTERKRFSAILQRLGPEQISMLESIIRHKPDDPYTQARARLIATDGTSQDEKLNRLLNGVDIPVGTRPCVILQKLRALVGTDPEADKLVRPIWMAKLPLRTQEVLSANQSDPLDSVCKTADRLHDLAERNEGHTFMRSQPPQQARQRPPLRRM